MDTPRFVQRIGKLRYIFQAPEGFAQRAWEFSGHLALPNLSSSVRIGKLRYIQSVYEAPECRNPDTLAQDLLSPPLRWLSRLQAQTQLPKLRANPFYYYLVARTRYYDQVFADAIDCNIGCIVNIGCGTDTRAYRFAEQLKFHGIKVIECDQAASIAIKQQLAKRMWQTDHVTYASVDLNDHGWADLGHRLDAIPDAALVILEGVSPYIKGTSYDQFLRFLVVKLPPGSVVAYDYKMRGYNDDFGVGDANISPFRLPATKHNVIAYHEALGYRVQRLELSSELSSRLLRNFATTCSFAEDGLIKLTIPARTEETAHISRLSR